MVLRSSMAGGNPHILVVDDEAMIRLDLVAVLEGAGLNVLDAADADEALDLLSGPHAINILLTDVQMPGSMDGLRLAHVVREHWPSVDLMLMSGNLNMPTHLMPARSSYLGKPLDRRALIRAIAAFEGSATVPDRIGRYR